MKKSSTDQKEKDRHSASSTSYNNGNIDLKIIQTL